MQPQTDYISLTPYGSWLSSKFLKFCDISAFNIVKISLTLHINTNNELFRNQISPMNFCVEVFELF